MLGKYAFAAAMTIGPERDGLINEVYDTEHVPEILKGVPGMISISRYRRVKPAATFYLALYEIATPDIPSGPHFMKARDIGRWPTEVRPHTRGLRNAAYEWQSGFGGDGSRRVPAPHLLFAEILPSVVGRDAAIDRTLKSLASIEGVTAGAHYMDAKNGSHLLAAALSAAAVDKVVELAALVANAEIYAAINSAAKT
jgi:hypothetical protein